MGNCQAAEADMLVIQHPGGRMERYYLAMTVSQVMTANPGHYVAVIVTAPLSSSSAGSTNPSGKKKGTSTGTASVQLLKLLSPDDTLRIGHFYYLVTFEDVLKVFGSKKCIKLSKLLSKQERRKRNKHDQDGDRGGTAEPEKNSSSESVEELEKNGDANMELEIGNGSINVRKCGQWKPTLQSIAEMGQ